MAKVSDGVPLSPFSYIFRAWGESGEKRKDFFLPLRLLVAAPGSHFQIRRSSLAIFFFWALLLLSRSAYLDAWLFSIGLNLTFPSL